MFNEPDEIVDRFRDWGYELPILFCGYSASDPHIQSILFDLFDRGIRRSTYFVVSPDISDFEARYWQANRIVPIRVTFEEFLRDLDGVVSSVSRAIPVRIGGGESSLKRHYRVSQPSESGTLLAFLSEDVDHVMPGMPFERQEPKDFYRGYDKGWGAIVQGLDARRDVSDSVMVDAVLSDEDQRTSPVDLFLINGPAGNGKTVCLKRIAWDAAQDYDKIVLFLRNGGAIRPDAIERDL